MLLRRRKLPKSHILPKKEEIEPLSNFPISTKSEITQIFHVVVVVIFFSL